MSFYDFIVEVIESFKQGWKDAHSDSVREVDSNGVALTTDGMELKNYMTSFYENRLNGALLDSDIRVYKEFRRRTSLLPNSAWNKLAESEVPAGTTIFFLSEWNGNVDELKL